MDVTKERKQRWCTICDAVSMRLQKRKSIALAIEEQTWTCTSCGGSVAFLPRGSRQVMGLLAAALAMALVAGFVLGKVRDGDELPIGLMMLALVGSLAYVVIASARIDRLHASGTRLAPYAPKLPVTPEPELWQPPTWRDRFYHPLVLYGIALTLLIGGYMGWRWLDQRRLEQTMAAVEPAAKRWTAIQAQAPAHLESIEAGLTDEAGGPTCEAIAGPIEVIHTSVLRALVHGGYADTPAWLNTQAYQFLSGAMTPGLDLASYEARNATVARALETPCVGVVDTSSVRSGSVRGTLTLVCTDVPRRCSIPLSSEPGFVVALVQDDASQLAGAGRDALYERGKEAYRAALVEALSRLASNATLASG